MKPLYTVLIIIPILLSACGTHWKYNEIGEGEFSGVLEVRWLEPDRFLFVPNKENPLRFTTADGSRIIEPGPMYTDGGSIPRIFWSVPGYSPWGLAPAYIIHDWIFDTHHCDTPGYENITFDQSSRFMAESIKTLMETARVPKDESLFFNVVSAVETPIAETIWKNGKCDLPPNQIAYGTIADAKPLLADETKDTEMKLRKFETDIQETSDIMTKKQLSKDVQILRNKLIELNRITAINAKQPINAPATKLLYTIDMSTSN